MQHRHAYALRDRSTLENALAAARREGVADHDLAVIARHDIELDLDPDVVAHEGSSKLSGLLAGLSAVTVPTLGVSVAGAGLLAQLGDNLAGWFPALASDDNDDLRSAYQQRIDAGQLLLIVDAPPELHNAVTAALVAEAGAEPLRQPEDA